MTQYAIRTQDGLHVVYATEFGVDHRDLASFKTPRQAIAFADSPERVPSENLPGGWDGALSEVPDEMSVGAFTPNDGAVAPDRPSFGIHQPASAAESAGVLRLPSPPGDGSAVTTRGLTFGL